MLLRAYLPACRYQQRGRIRIIDILKALQVDLLLLSLERVVLVGIRFGFGRQLLLQAAGACNLGALKVRGVLVEEFSLERPNLGRCHILAGCLPVCWLIAFLSG